jgi:hypothetical protein
MKILALGLLYFLAWSSPAAAPDLWPMQREAL